MNYANTYYLKTAVLFILPESLSLPHRPFVLSVWTWFLISVWGSCLSQHDSQTEHQTLMPYVVRTATPGAQEWCFPPGITAAAKGWRRQALAWLQTSESVVQGLLGNPPDSWVEGQEAEEGAKQEACHLGPWAKQLHSSGEDGLRRGRGRQESISVTDDTPEGRWIRCESQWIRNPLNWALLLDLNCVLLDKSQLSYMPGVKWRRLGKRFWNTQPENVLSITVLVTAPDSINAHI